jgi:hypothetical protein
VADNVLELVLDDTPGCTSPLESISISELATNDWGKRYSNVSDPTALTAIRCVAISATVDPGTTTLSVDLIQGPPEVQKVHISLTNSIPTEGVAVIQQTDTNNDGLFSDEASQVNNIVVSYMDQEKLVRDLAWSVKELGRGNGDVDLEAGETFLFTVELRGINPVPTSGTLMTFHIAPQDNVALVLEKFAPSNISPSMILR